MPIDGVFLSHITKEISSSIIGCRLDKITQPDSNEIRLQFKSISGEKKLLVLNAAQGTARIHFTLSPRENPETPPMFCMLARKLFSGARLLRVDQTPCERILSLVFGCYDDFGDPCERSFVFELAGRIPNILMLSPEGKIIDCVKRVNIEDNPLNRPMLPGLVYHPPELPVGKLPVSDADFSLLPDQIRTSENTAADFLQNHFYGLSPAVCREIAYGFPDHPVCTFSQEDILRFIQKLSDAVTQSPCPCAVTDKSGKLLSYSFLKLQQFGNSVNLKIFSTCSELLDFCFGFGSFDTTLKTLSSEVLRPVKNAASKLEKKLALQKSELARADGRERLRELGDILNAYLYMVPKGAEKIELPDLYSPEGNNVVIPLDPSISPQRNAQKYYTEYRKLKSAKIHLEKLIDEGEKELDYLNNMMYLISDADIKTIKAIKQELVAEGILRSHNIKNIKKESTSAPKDFVLSNGMHLLCGRTAQQNEMITFKIASKNDWWFHVKNAPGSHCVLLCNGETPSDTAFEEAAAIASENSSLKGSSHVEVEYTLVKNLKRVPGAKPGTVIYDKYYTLFTK